MTTVISYGAADADGLDFAPSVRLAMQLDVLQVFKAHGLSDHVVFRGTGIGSYTNDAGKTYHEPAYTYVLTCDLSEAAERDLAKVLCTGYGQESYAVTRGDTRFVKEA